jgi:hypothetical protein
MCHINMNRTAKHGLKYVMCHINVNRIATPIYKNVITT